jgi:hypothetical protein
MQWEYEYDFELPIAGTTVPASAVCDCAWTGMKADRIEVAIERITFLNRSWAASQLPPDLLDALTSKAATNINQDDVIDEERYESA